VLNKLLNIRIIFAGLVVVAFAYGIYEAFSYAYLAKIFPLYISLAMFVLACINLVMEIRISWRQLEHSGVGFVDLEAQWDMAMAEVLKRFGFFLGIVLVLYGCILIIGYPLSITLFVILFYRLITNTSWWTAVVAGLAGLGFISLISKLLVIDWPSGVIQNWIHLPWPLG
jgi:hypothetical protein